MLRDESRIFGKEYEGGKMNRMDTLQVPNEYANTPSLTI